MSYKDLQWVCKDGTKTYACIWMPNNPVKIKAVIGLVHGMGEHSGRYGHVAKMLNEDGYVVIAYDQRGHGRTEGKRGHTPSYEALLEGVETLISESARKYPELPFFLYGHSMGGNVALNYLLRRKPQIAGAIVTGPWLKLAFKPPTIQAAIGRLVEAIYPQFTSVRPMVAEHLTSDPAMIKLYKNDKLIHGKITARFYFSVHNAGLWALDHASELSVPLLLMHASEDAVTSTTASQKFAEDAGASCTWRAWPGFQHEIHNEVKREQVFKVIRDWLNDRLEIVNAQ